MMWKYMNNYSYIPHHIILMKKVVYHWASAPGCNDPFEYLNGRILLYFVHILFYPQITYTTQTQIQVNTSINSMNSPIVNVTEEDILIMMTSFYLRASFRCSWLLKLISDIVCPFIREIFKTLKGNLKCLMIFFRS